ncbi:MAG: insulinase family protein [Alphaproteobacteria bacterium]|nr:insulinase family protein [Alphaproteobacteria bacterium]
MDVTVSTLANGLRVVSDPMIGLESVAIGVWVNAGARAESAEENGVAHMLEHMAFKGTERRTARAIAEEIEAVGGHLNAYTSREHTAYFARVLKRDVPLAVDLLADILQHSAFEESELERERGVVLQEIGQTEDTPDDLIFDRLQEAAYPGQSLGRSILGTSELVTAMDRGRLTGFMARHYGAQSMTLVGSGAIEHAALMALAERHFGALGRGAERPMEAARFTGGATCEERELEQVHFAIAWPGVRYHDDDFYASQVLATTLGGGMSSRLFQEVREKRGLCYSVFAFATSYVDAGMLGIYAGTGEQEVGELVPVVLDETQRLAVDAEEAEVARARAQISAGLLMSLESPSARSEQLARQLLIFGRPIPPDELVAKIDQVDAAAVRRVAARITGAGRPAVAAVGPLARLASYEAIAARFA